jgi:hypothetical protein
MANTFIFRFLQLKQPKRDFLWPILDRRCSTNEAGLEAGGVVWGNIADSTGEVDSNPELKLTVPFISSSILSRFPSRSSPSTLVHSICSADDPTSSQGMKSYISASA